MNGLKEDFSKLSGNMLFSRWKSSHKDSFFSYAFNAVEDQRMGKWQFGFYDRASQKVASFVVDGDNIEVMGEDEVFKEPDKEVLEVTVESVKMPILEVFDRTIEFAARKYPDEVVGKIILVLQNLPKYGDIWNITLITAKMNTINLKVDPATGMVKFHKLASIFGLDK